jgi:hypothetical protein
MAYTGNQTERVGSRPERLVDSRWRYQGITEAPVAGPGLPAEVLTSYGLLGVDNDATAANGLSGIAIVSVADQVVVDH